MVLSIQPLIWFRFVPGTVGDLWVDWELYFALCLRFLLRAGLVSRMGSSCIFRALFGVSSGNKGLRAVVSSQYRL